MSESYEFTPEVQRRRSSLASKFSSVSQQVNVPFRNSSLIQNSTGKPSSSRSYKNLPDINNRDSSLPQSPHTSENINNINNINNNNNNNNTNNTNNIMSESDHQTLAGGDIEKAAIPDIAPTKEEEKDPFVVEFAPDDKENPKNWPNWYKWWCTLFSSVLILNATFASSAPSTALEAVVMKFHTDTEVAILPISLFLLGYVIGPGFWAPLSEVYGRKTIFIITLFLYTVFNIGCALSPTITGLLLCRLISGTAAASPLTNSGGVLTDIWPIDRLGIPMALFSLAPFLGPVLGPICGGFITQYAGWQWIYYVLIIFGFVCWVLVIIALPETFGPTILERRAKKLRKQTGDNRYQSVSEKSRPPIGQILSVSLTRPFRLLFTEPIVIFSSIYVAIVYGILYMSFEMYPLEFQGQHHMQLGVSGLAFISIGIGLLLSFVTTSLFDIRYQKKLRAIGRRPDAEERLLPAIFVGGPCFAISLFWFAWTSYPWIHWMAPMASGVLLGLGVVIIFTSFLSYLADAYVIFAASALAANTISRSILGAVFPLFVRQMFEGMTIKWAATLLAIIVTILIPIPVIFYKKGAAIRSRSTFAKSS